MIKNLLKCQKPVSNSFRTASVSFSSEQSSHKSEIDLKLANLKYHLTFTQKVSKNAFLTLIKLIENEKECDSRVAFTMFRLCGMQLIDIAPHKRQHHLDYLFNTLFPSRILINRSMPTSYTLDHYEAYMTSSLINEGQFCPFELSRRITMSRNKQLPRLSLDACLIRRLCQLDEINVVLARLVDVVLEGPTRRVDFEYYKSVKQLDFDVFMKDVFVKSNSSGSEETTAAGGGATLVDLVNPLIFSYLSRDETHKAISLFQGLLDRQLEPTSTTYASLISGYVRARKLDDARKLFDKSYDKLKLIDCFDVQLELLKGIHFTFFLEVRI